MDRGADLCALSCLTALSSLTLSVSIRPPQLRQIAALSALRALTFGGVSPEGVSVGVPDRFVAALTCLSALTQLSSLSLKVIKVRRCTVVRLTGGARWFLHHTCRACEIIAPALGATELSGLASRLLWLWGLWGDVGACGC